jgi:hypothetical protein
MREKKFQGSKAHNRKYAKPFKPLGSPTGALDSKSTPKTNE